MQLQLLTYLDAVSKQENAQPAGVLYFNLNEPIESSSKNETAEEIEKKIRKEFKMAGLVLADVRVFRMMDKNLKQGYSEIIPVSVLKGDEIGKKSSVATKEQFQILQKYIIKTIKDISKDILSGKIEIKPYYKNKKVPCEYCKYKSICMFDKNKFGNEYNYVPKLPKEQVWENMEKEIKEEKGM